MKKLIPMIVGVAALSGTVQAKVFNVEIGGERVVADFWVQEEQAWQYTQEGEDAAWWPGLAPHPYQCKFWYPNLSNTFNMVLNEQLSFIDTLNYGGISDWRIANYWDSVPLKCSVFQYSLILDGTSRVTGFDPSVYFMPTSTYSEGMTGGTTYFTHGRLGDEDGLVTGGLISATMDRYSKYGTVVPNRKQYYMLPFADYADYGNKGTEAQDHFICSNASSGQCFFDDSPNYTPEDNPMMEQSGERDGGAWTVSEATPALWPADKSFVAVSISDVMYQSGIYNPRLDAEDAVTGVEIPVTITAVQQDERRGPEADATIEYTETAAVVNLRAESQKRNDGRVYHITFTDKDGREHVLKVAVPVTEGVKAIDGGALYESTK